ncbi:hypothetical protein C7S14_8126 [Burkholderia cepacia]|nr:hypothetical protein C7S14_8126 [Burkholderia cepacia]
MRLTGDRHSIRFERLTRRFPEGRRTTSATVKRSTSPSRCVLRCK